MALFCVGSNGFQLRRCFSLSESGTLLLTKRMSSGQRQSSYVHPTSRESLRETWDESGSDLRDAEKEGGRDGALRQGIDFGATCGQRLRTSRDAGEARGSHARMWPCGCGRLFSRMGLARAGEGRTHRQSVSQCSALSPQSRLMSVLRDGGACTETRGR